MPFIIGVILAFIIIKKENLEREFSEWSREHKKVVEVFTLLAGADIEVLIILESNIKIPGFDLFNAKFSEAALNRIFWGSCFKVLTEDIPQIVIQVFLFYFFRVICLLKFLLSFKKFQ